MSADSGGSVRGLRRAVARCLPPRVRIRVAQRLARWRRRLRTLGRWGLADVGGARSTVLVTVLEADEPELERCLDALRAAGGAAAGALVLTDVDAFMLLRASGLAFEYVPPREDWRTSMGADYDEFVRARTAGLAAAYGARRTLAWSDSPDGLLAALGKGERRARPPLHWRS